MRKDKGLAWFAFFCFIAAFAVLILLVNNGCTFSHPAEPEKEQGPYPCLWIFYSWHYQEAGPCLTIMYDVTNIGHADATNIEMTWMFVTEEGTFYTTAYENALAMGENIVDCIQVYNIPPVTHVEYYQTYFQPFPGED